MNFQFRKKKTLCGRWCLQILMDIFRTATKNMCTGSCEFKLECGFLFADSRKNDIYLFRFQWEYSEWRRIEGRVDCTIFATVPTQRHWLPSPCIRPLQTRAKTEFRWIESSAEVTSPCTNKFGSTWMRLHIIFCLQQRFGGAHFQNDGLLSQAPG